MIHPLLLPPLAKVAAIMLAGALVLAAMIWALNRVIRRE